MRMYVVVSITIVSCLFASFVSANDGVDRYHQDRTVVFGHLYAPLSEKAGFTVLAEDMAGGADGAPSFRWARPFTLSIVRLAAWHTARTLGLSANPLAIFDLSGENGDTPVSRDEGSPPRGRHPGGSHDGGVNLDLGYYMTGLKGLQEDPDYAVCDDHYSPTETTAEGTPKDAYECLGPANRLDVARQSFYFLSLFKMHRDLFNYMLLEEVGVDSRVKIAVLDQIRVWQKQGLYDIDAGLIEEMARVMTCARWEGWARFHHHHTHVRFHDLSETGEFRRVFEKVAEEERAMELSLFGDKHPSDKVFLKADLYSYGLSRFVELSLLQADSTVITTAEYRLDEGAWTASEEADNHFRSIIDVPQRIPSPEGTLRVAVKYETTDGVKAEITRELYSPQFEAQAKIKVQRAQLLPVITITSSDNQVIWECGLDYPAYYDYYITGIEYVFYLREKPDKPERVKAVAGEKTRFIQEANSTMELVEAVVTLSSRVNMTVPVYVALP